VSAFLVGSDVSKGFGYPRGAGRVMDRKPTPSGPAVHVLWDGGRAGSWELESDLTLVNSPEPPAVATATGSNSEGTTENTPLAKESEPPTSLEVKDERRTALDEIGVALFQMETYCDYRKYVSSICRELLPKIQRAQNALAELHKEGK
jgi:hypothetical protein